ncbi:MAG TPA: gamma-glutamylcyclotransferase [Burkholderiaceae bacterium]
MDPSEHEQTRRRLAEGTFVAALRAGSPAGVRLRSDAELEASRAAALSDLPPGADLHVFGYGSLMWNPALDVADARPARVHGWHRRFCLRLLIGRGTLQEPGAMLALDRGGVCRGMLYRIDAAKVEAETRLLWRREMLAGSYRAQWVRAHAGSEAVTALTFVTHRRHDRYIGDHPVDTVARLIRTGRGPLGTSRAYFDATVQTLEQLGIRDRGIERLRRAILRQDAQPPVV